MSEKRFRAVDGTFKHIIEDKEQKRVYLMSLYEHNQEVADLLNSLSEENEQLKEEHKIAIDEMITDYKNLEEENEQLRKELKEIKENPINYF